MNRMYGKKSWYKLLVGRCERKGTLEKKLGVTVRIILKWVLKIRRERVNFHLADRQSACEQISPQSC